MQRENSIALRWTTVFGVSPRMRSGLIVNDLTAKAVHERIIVLYDPDSRRSFVHVSDLVRGYMFALERSRNMAGGVFNMGSERLNLTKRDLAACIQDLQPCKVIDSGVMDKDVRNFIPSFEKIRALGFDTNVSLGQGVSELIKLYLVHTPHYQIRPI